MLIPVVTRSKVLVCGRSVTRIAGSNLIEDMDVCVCVSLVIAVCPSDGSISRTEEFYPIVVCINECHLETSTVRRPRAHQGSRAMGTKLP